ncbi:MAG: ACT domain-containing protein [Coriobacteriales bacterium]|jgi:prephenate dehydratase|nr:ACT domain-containing protein [Coriobacteriales bacterium]
MHKILSKEAQGASLTAATYAYLGPAGTYCHQAALLALTEMSDLSIRQSNHAVLDVNSALDAAAALGADALSHCDDADGLNASEAAATLDAEASATGRLIECASISEVFDYIKRGRATYGVVPIENALEGSVNETLDAFAFNSKAFIVREIVLDIHHNLIVAPGTNLADVKVVASHPQALAQCREWLLANCPGVQTIATTSTAQAVRGLTNAVAPAIDDGIASCDDMSSDVAGQAQCSALPSYKPDGTQLAQGSAQLSHQAAGAQLAQSSARSGHQAAGAHTAQNNVQPSYQAAIGASLAAQIFGAKVAASQIEDHYGNQTRFVVMGNKMAMRSGNDKTSLALFMREDRPGTLLMILAEFAYAGLNLTKIQSRPTKQALGDYMFWIDVDGYADDLDLKTALDSLRLKLREVKLLGSYPCAR